MTDNAKLLLKRSRGEGLIKEDYDVISDGQVVGRIFNSGTSASGRPWFWGFAYGHHRDRFPISGYEPTREAAMATFRKGWLRE